MTAKLRGPQIDAGTGANQLVQLDGSGNLPAIDGSAITNVDATALNGSADTAFAKLASVNVFTDSQFITSAGATALSLSGSGANNIAIRPSGSTSYGADLKNVAAASGTYSIDKLNVGGAVSATMSLNENGAVTLTNSVNAAAVTISAAGAITLNAATGQRITSSDDHRFFRTATFTSVSTAGTAIDWSLSNKFICTAASGTLTFSGNPSAPASLVLKLTGTPSLPAAVQWPDGGAEPAKTGVTIVGLFYDGSTYYAMQGTDFL